MNAYQFLLNRRGGRADSTNVRDIAEKLERDWNAVISAHLAVAEAVE